MNNYWHGMHYLFLGVSYLGTKGLKRFIILPVLFNFLFFSLLAYLLYYYLFPYTDDVVQYLPSWMSFVKNILMFIILVSAFLLFLSLFTVFFNLIAAPFNGLLAEKTQKIFFASHLPSYSFLQITLRSIKRQLQFIAYFSLRLLLMFVLFFIPFIHPIYPVLWFFFNAWILSVQYQDFVMDNNGNSFSVMLEKLKREKAMTLGFGTIIHLATFVPIINIITMPAAVIGSVFLYADENNLKRKH